MAACLHLFCIFLFVLQLLLKLHELQTAIAADAESKTQVRFRCQSSIFCANLRPKFHVSCSSFPDGVSRFNYGEFRYPQLAQEKVKLETENRKLKYRITHLARNLEEAVTAQRAQ